MHKSSAHRTVLLTRLSWLVIITVLLLGASGVLDRAIGAAPTRVVAIDKCETLTGWSAQGATLSLGSPSDGFVGHVKPVSVDAWTSPATLARIGITRKGLHVPGLRYVRVDASGWMEQDNDLDPSTIRVWPTIVVNGRTLKPVTRSGVRAWYPWPGGTITSVAIALPANPGHHNGLANQGLIVTNLATVSTLP